MLETIIDPCFYFAELHYQTLLWEKVCPQVFGHNRHRLRCHQVSSDPVCLPSFRCVSIKPCFCSQSAGSRQGNQSEHLWHGRASFLLWGDLLLDLWHQHDRDCSSLAFPSQVRNEFYKDSQGVLLVYDVGLRESFDALDSWLGEMKQEMGSQANMDSIVFIVCANKVSLVLLIYLRHSGD